MNNMHIAHEVTTTCNKNQDVSSNRTQRQQSSEKYAARSVR